MVYLLLNCDEFLAAQHIATLKAALGPAEMADLNIAELEGAKTSAADLLRLAPMMPFLAPRRLLLVHGFLRHLDKRLAASLGSSDADSAAQQEDEWLATGSDADNVARQEDERLAASSGAESAAQQEAKRLLNGLADWPEHCDLVFVEQQGIDRRRHLWKGFTPVARGGERVRGLETLIAEGKIRLESQKTPDAKTLPAWLRQRAKEKQIDIQPRAMHTLIDYVGPNLRQLGNELEKLATYAVGRAITEHDVKLLVSDTNETLIWNLTDALSQRNGRNAMLTLYELWRGDANPFYLLSMMARQFRIMIKTKAAMEQDGRVGDENDIAKRIGEKPFPVKKAMQQARKYSEAELDAIMNRLLEADFAMKTGADQATEIDMLVAELTQKRA